MIMDRLAEKSGQVALGVVGGEALLRQKGGGHAVLGGASGMEALGHGAELDLQPYRLGGGDAQRPDHLL